MNGAQIRNADAADVEEVLDVVRRAFVGYVPRIGQEPMPMGLDYSVPIGLGQCRVAEVDGRIVGVLVLVPEDGYLHLDIIAVAPDAQGAGIGTQLLRLAESEATAAGYAEVRLFTHEKMTENIAYYGRHGYRETHRQQDDGFSRVFFTRELNGNAVRLRPPRNPVDPRAVGWWTTNLLLATAAPVGVLVLLGVLISPARFWLLMPAVVIGVAGLLATATLPRWWFRVHRWEVTDTAVYTRTGFFWQEWRVAPHSRIQTVDTRRGPLEQRFGLATVVVTTASARGPVTMPALAHEQAEEIAAQLTEITQSVPGDAT